MAHMETTEDRGKIGADKIILGLLAVLLIGALFFLSSQRQQALRSSPAGLDGLRVWLSHEGLNVQNFSGGWPLNTEDVGLLIVPLYDTRLSDRRTPPQTKEELLAQQDEFDLWEDVTREKARKTKTLLILPKWRSGMRLTGLAHPLLLNDPKALEALAKNLIIGDAPRLVPSRKPFTTFPYSPQDGVQHDVTLYAAQTLVAPQCDPIIGDETAMLLGSCPLRTSAGAQQVFVLSDPDLLNNHGLRLGDNAFAVRDFVRQVAPEERVIIDYSPQNWLTEGIKAATRERSWSDIMRFFSPPFTVMWAGLALAIALTLWRAAVRFGPLLPAPSGIGASKMMAIAARAKLMLLSNRDGALAGEYARARIAATANAIFGAAHGRQFSAPETFVAYAQRRHPSRVIALTTALNTIETLPDTASQQQAMASITALDRILKEIEHDA